MAACPVDVTPLSLRRRPLALTQRRLEANRRNAARSTGPRTADGKARVARNAIKHGFFVAQEKWTPAQRHDFETTLDGLRDDLQPQGMLEESCVETIAASYVRMASVLRYENIAALEHHQNLDREMSQRIAAAAPPEAARLQAQRDRLRRAGLWRPTIPAEREAKAIIRYAGCIDRAIRRASSQLEILKNMRSGGASSSGESQKRREIPSSSVPRLGEGPPAPTGLHENAKTNPLVGSPRSAHQAAERPPTANSEMHENEKTNPLSSMFTGNRHQRRRAKALARRR